MEETLNIQRVDKETLSGYADWVFPRYYGDTRWGLSVAFKCNRCMARYGYAMPTDRLYLENQKKKEVLVCKAHSTV